jgi:hypothetical protein
MPAAVLALHLQRLDPAYNRSMLFQLYSSYCLEARIRPPAAVGRLPLGTIPAHKQNLIEPPIGLEAWIAHSPNVPLGVAGTLEVDAEDRVEATESLLLGGERVAARVG